jgi:hypothetical protein
MKAIVAIICLGVLWFLIVPAIGESAELRINNKMTPASGWAVISIQQGTEPRPVGTGQGGLTFETLGDTFVAAAEALFISEPLLVVENSRGEISFSIDEFGPDGIVFSFASSIADVGLDNSRPFAYIALQVNPAAVPGTQAIIHLDPERTILCNEAGEPEPLTVRDGLFTVGGLSISCIDPPTGMVAAGQSITISGVGFEPRAQVEFDGIPENRARVIDENTIVATAPMDFVADDVEVRVRNRTPGPGRDRPQDFFVSHRFGCFTN